MSTELKYSITHSIDESFPWGIDGPTGATSLRYRSRGDAAQTCNALNEAHQQALRDSGRNGPKASEGRSEANPCSTRAALAASPKEAHPEVMGGIGSEPYRVEQSVLDPTLWQVRDGDGNPVLTIRPAPEAVTLADALNAAFKAGLSQRDGDEEPAAWMNPENGMLMNADDHIYWKKRDDQSGRKLMEMYTIPLYRRSVEADPVTWHSPADKLPPNDVPKGYVILAYSNRKDEGQDYSLRPVGYAGPCVSDEGDDLAWSDWYGCIPTPDKWAMVNVPEISARWFMPKRDAQHPHPEPVSKEIVEAGNAMCAILCLFYKEAATTLPEQLRKKLVELVNAWDAALKAGEQDHSPDE